jgi:hypothetical protein
MMKTKTTDAPRKIHSAWSNKNRTRLVIARVITRFPHRTPHILIFPNRSRLPNAPVHRCQVLAAAPSLCRCSWSSARPARPLRHHICRALLTRPRAPAADQRPEPKGVFSSWGGNGRPGDDVGEHERPDDGGVVAERHPPCASSGELEHRRSSWSARCPPPATLLRVRPVVLHRKNKSCMPLIRVGHAKGSCGSQPQFDPLVARNFRSETAREIEEEEIEPYLFRFFRFSPPSWLLLRISLFSS